MKALIVAFVELNILMMFFFFFRNNILMMWMATLFMPKNDPYMIILNTPLIKNLI